MARHGVSGSQQAQGAEAGFFAAGDDQVVVQDDAQGFGGGGDLLGHFDVGPAGRSIARGVVVDQDQCRGAQFKARLTTSRG